MATDEEHAFAAGYEGKRGVRSWRERIHVLETAGIIRTRSVGGKKFAYVLLVHPALFVEELRTAGKVTDSWYEAYRIRRAETGELPLETVQEAEAAVVALGAGVSEVPF